MAPEEGDMCIVIEIKGDNVPQQTDGEYFRFSKPEFINWQFDSTAQGDGIQRLAENTLSVLSTKEIHNLLKVPSTALEGYSVNPRRNMDNVFEFDLKNFQADGKPATIFHVLLPEYFYSHKKLLIKSERETVYLITHNTRQSITWVHDYQEDRTKNKVNIGLVFFGQNARNFEEMKARINNRIEISKDQETLLRKSSDFQTVETNKLVNEHFSSWQSFLAD